MIPHVHGIAPTYNRFSTNIARIACTVRCMPKRSLNRVINGHLADPNSSYAVDFVPRGVSARLQEARTSLVGVKVR